jgi:glycine betaine/proline transport system permease protein
MKFSLAMENEIMGGILNDSKDPEDAATDWLKANPDAIGLARRRDHGGWRRCHGGGEGQARHVSSTQDCWRGRGSAPGPPVEFGVGTLDFLQEFLLSIWDAVRNGTKIPVGKWAKQAVDWLIDTAGFLFDWLSAVLKTMIDGLVWLLELPHPFLFTALVVALALWLKRSVPLAVFVALSLLFIINQGYWDDMIKTLALIIASGGGVHGRRCAAGHCRGAQPRFSAFLRPVLDLMQTIPTFVYLIPALILFGLGMVPGLVATVIFAIPAPIRLTELGVKSTPTQLLEAGEAFGATPRQHLWKVELPWALPQIMAGLNQTIMLSLSMVVIAALVGAPVSVCRWCARSTGQHRQGLRGGLIIVLVAIVLDRLCRVSEKGRG